ncbi:MAG: hypothetical protein OXP69_05625 [Spirochaetaceae bacterium]|nr:hypothetical protein [Spirochaetaceae bacterium]
MPELPSVTVYVEHLRRRTVDRTLERVRIANPFVLRSVDPPINAAHGRRVQDVERLGKRIVFTLSGDLYLVIHLMVAGRLRWHDDSAAAKIPRKVGLAGFQFDSGTLVLTEAGSKRRASVHLAAGKEGLAEHERGGLEVLESDAAAFREALLRENHTLKRALADPRLFSGVGNAFSDEILHRAGLSPLQLTARMDDEQVDTLHGACVAVLSEWVELLRAESGEEFPKKVTAFHPKMAVHGKYGQPCPACGTPVQRIRYAANESNYCPKCQTGGKLLADRALSRLLKSDWPRSVDELEDLRRPRNED